MNRKLVFGVVVGFLILASIFFLVPFSLYGAYESFPVEFDELSTSPECKGESYEFETVVDTYHVDGSMAYVEMSHTPVKTFCGLSDDFWYGDGKLYFGMSSFSSSHTYNSISHPKPFIRAHFCKGFGSPNMELPNPSCFYSTSISDSEEEYYPITPTSVGANDYLFIVYQMSQSTTKYFTQSWKVGANSIVTGYYHVPYGQSRLYVTNPNLDEDFTVRYVIPMDSIPETLHYREYSCPNPVGYYLVTDTFRPGDTVSLDSFSYVPNYFCERHPAIVVDEETASSFNDYSIYNTLLSGEDYIVPAGQSVTLFYVTTNRDAAPQPHAGLKLWDYVSNIWSAFVSWLLELFGLGG